jgi:hypothetical protein
MPLLFPLNISKFSKNSKMKSTDKNSFLKGVPSWGLALITMVLAFVVLMVVGDIIAAVFKISDENTAAELIFYMLYNLTIAMGCFFICRRDYKSVWYVPVLCNVVGIISAIVEPNFWISSLWIVICGGWILSLAAALVGVYFGKKTEKTAGK